LEPVTFFDRTDDWSLSVQQASCKRAITVATVTWSLKRAGGRLSVQCPVFSNF